MQSLPFIVIGDVVIVLMTVGRIAFERHHERDESVRAVPRLTVLMVGFAMAAVGFTAAFLILPGH